MLSAPDTLDQIEFRPAIMSDVEGLADLYSEFFQFSDLPDLGLHFAPQRAAARILKAIDTGAQPHLVAVHKESGRIVGLISYAIDDSNDHPFAFLGNFYVAAGWRLTAIGRVLLDLVLDAAAADGAVAFRAGLSAGAPYSKNLFLKLGFTETPGSVLMSRRL